MERVSDFTMERLLFCLMAALVFGACLLLAVLFYYGTRPAAVDRARALIELGRYEEAIRTAIRGMFLSPSNSSVPGLDNNWELFHLARRACFLLEIPPGSLLEALDELRLLLMEADRLNELEPISSPDRLAEALEELRRLRRKAETRRDDGTESDVDGHESMRDWGRLMREFLSLQNRILELLASSA